MNLQQIVTVTLAPQEHRDVLAALDAAYASVTANRKMNPMLRSAWRAEIDDLRVDLRVAGPGCCLALTREQINVLLPALDRGANELAGATATGSIVVDQVYRIKGIGHAIAASDLAAVPIESATRSVRSVQPVR